MKKVAKNKPLKKYPWLNFYINWIVNFIIIENIYNAYLIIKYFLFNSNNDLKFLDNLLVFSLIIDLIIIIYYIITIIYVKGMKKSGYYLLFGAFISETVFISASIASKIAKNNLYINLTNKETFYNNFFDNWKVYFIILFIIWLIPNYLYLRKKKGLFLSDKLQKRQINLNNSDMDFNNKKATENKKNPFSKNMKLRREKVLFCRCCGAELDINNKCTMCMKQFFKFKNIFKKKYLLISALVISIGFNICQYIDLKQKLNYWPDQLYHISLSNSINAAKADFLENNVVFVVTGYGKYYYTYSCMIKIVGDNQYSFLAFNKDTAESFGYIEGYCD